MSARGEEADLPDAMTPIVWSVAEPGRLERDLEEVRALVPGVEYVSANDGSDGALAHHGACLGVLPMWPFDRLEPGHLTDLLGGSGLGFILLYPAAYPMVPPAIHPTNLEPEIIEQTQSRWHVAPGGALCLLQSEGAWLPEASVAELLLKAAGWRIEYALMKAGVLTQMTTSGIVSDDSIDHLIPQAVESGATTDSSAVRTTETIEEGDVSA
ncbi:hypothetical protein ACFWAY_51900 [Rhodococcus sp. NPDC059968]|uniref:hypothetical protein n=1 Tax=Rhodococcus sp. NPDC059968 TaxID=3347017 RepID=UPI00366A87FD